MFLDNPYNIKTNRCRSDLIVVDTGKGKTLALMPVVYKGQWGLGSNGIFRCDPWYLVSDKRIIKSGFDAPPRDYEQKVLDEGVILPGLVNSHTHLQFSFFVNPANQNTEFQNSRERRHGNVHEFALSLMSAQTPSLDEQVRMAEERLSHAKSSGTFFFLDICNSPEFSARISLLKEFEGIRFLELLGFAPPADKRRIEMADLALKIDSDLHFAMHSIYGSSPEIFSYIRQKEKRISSIHLLEEEDEAALFLERGRTFDFLCQIGQYSRHSEIFQSDIASYLQKALSELVKILLVHMTFADESLLYMLGERFPASALVICPRSNKNLGYSRKNWQTISNAQLPLLIGTDSCASSPDVSVLHEIAALISMDVLSEDLIWRAATSNAYQYLELASVPMFLFPGANPEIQTLLNTSAKRLDMIKST